MKEPDIGNPRFTRRGFAQRSATAALAAMAVPVLAPKLAAKHPDKIRLGLVGCGNRGTGAVMDAILAAPNVEVVAMADMFPEKIEASLKRLRTPQKGQTRDLAAQYGSLVVDWDRLDAVRVNPERCFTGFGACEQLLQMEVDIVILAGPPGFRPRQIRAVLEAGKHVFAEKPVAVDPAGARWVFESAELAGQKKLGFMGARSSGFRRPTTRSFSACTTGGSARWSRRSVSGGTTTSCAGTRIPGSRSGQTRNSRSAAGPTSCGSPGITLWRTSFTTSM